LANKKLVEIVKRGRAVLAKWRLKNPDILLDLNDAVLNGANLRGANLRRAKLVGAKLCKADLVGANLSGAEMTRADLRGAKLIKTEFYSADVVAVDFSGADLSGAYFRKSNLSGADLSEANLTKADLIEADLSQASFRAANLTGADLSRAKLDGTNFDQAVFSGLSLGDVDLSNARSLDSINHLGPSTLGIDTFYRSQGKLSQTFLRGCGIPEGLTANIETVTGNPVEKFFCYICFVSEELMLVERLYDALQEKGVRCWMIPQPQSGGEGASKEPQREIGPRDRYLIVASRNSLRKKWLVDKLNSLLDAEEQIQKQYGKGARLLYPLNVDGYMFSGDWRFKREKLITTRVAADFTGWRRNADKFDQELELLIKVLKGEKVKRKG